MVQDLMSKQKACEFMCTIFHLKFYSGIFCSFWKELHKMCCLYLPISSAEAIKHLHYRTKRKKYNSFSTHRESKRFKSMDYHLNRPFV